MGYAGKRGECEVEDKELKEVLDSHKKWLSKEDDGMGFFLDFFRTPIAFLGNLVYNRNRKEVAL